MAANEEFKRFQHIWGLLLVAAGMLQLVNSLEGAFARTLITCDVASDPTPQGGLWSGSAKCGDRAFVINQGAKLSSAGQSQESIAKFIMMATAAVCSDIYGRKPILIAGLTCTTMSVVLFVIATMVDDWARTLFVLGQALQGAYSPALLSGLVAADLAQRSDTDKVGIYGAEAFVTQTAGTMFGLVAFAMQLFDVANYFPVWILVLAINLSTLVFAIKRFPETRVKTGSENTQGQQGVIAGTIAELTTYKQMFFDNWRLRILLFAFLIDRMGSSIEFVSLPILMANHNMTQAGAILLFFPVGFVGAACVGYVDSLTRKHGMQRAFVIGLTIQFSVALLTPLHPICWWAMYVQVYIIGGLMSGWKGLTSAMDNQGFGDKVGKFICIRSLFGHSICIVSAPLYAWLFDAGATTYVGKALPSLFSFGFVIMSAALFFIPMLGIYPMAMERLDSLAKERAAAAAVKASESPKSPEKDDSSSTECPSAGSSREDLRELEEDQEVIQNETQKKTQ